MIKNTGSRYVRVLAMAVSIAALPWLTGCNNTPNTLKIGVAQPLTGKWGQVGQDLLNGVQLAVNEINTEGLVVDGKRVSLELVFLDDKGEASTAKVVAQQLVHAGVVAVIGHMNGSVATETAAIYAAKNIALMSIATDPRLTQLGLSNTFRIVANDDAQARAMGSFAATQLNTEYYAVIDDGTVYGKNLADGAARQLAKEKKEVVIRETLDEKTVSFDAFAAKLKIAKVGVLVTTLSETPFVALLKALKKSGHSKIVVVGGDNVKTAEVIKNGGLVDNIFVATPILDPNEFSTGRPFLNRYEAAFKKLPNYGAHYSYDSTHVLAAAIKKAKSGDPEEITKALHAISGYAPVTGTMAWNEAGEQRYGAVAIYNLRGDAWEFRMRSDRW